ncbi:MAG TPA: transcription elongation factor GreA [Xanthobacteraceae bacterium]|jgi:transcription elongation factor GreA|nr:transcription elongation factor GreA [Xanthobacteraceae bacterium]
MKSIPITTRGYAALKQELEHKLKVERPRLVEQVAVARRVESNPLESAELQSALDAQKDNETRIAELEDQLARAEVIDPARLSGSTIKFGATVMLVDADTGEKKAFQIVGEPEADLRAGKISCRSPIGRSLIGQEKGTSVEVITPKGPKTYEVKQLRWR